MNTSVISLLFLVFYNISFGDVENSVDRQICDGFNKEFKNLSVNIVNNRPEDKVKPTVSKVEQGADLIKDQFDQEIRCQYNIQILNGDQPKTQLIYSKECFDISAKADYSVEYEAIKTKIEMNGKSKILVRIVWQIIIIFGKLVVAALSLKLYLKVLMGLSIRVFCLKIISIMFVCKRGQTWKIIRTQNINYFMQIQVF